MGSAPRAYGNTGFDFHEDDDLDGAELDAALMPFYKYCLDNDVPILAHCNRSNHFRPMYADQAHPKY